MNRALLFAVAGLFGLTAHAREKPEAATFSIVARDPATGELGVAVASRYFAVGSVVPWAKAGVGAVATQSFVNPTFGPRGLELLGNGMSPTQALKALLASDDDPSGRQVGIVNASGDSVTYSGPKCNPWAGGRQGPNYAIQGNILTGESVVTAMEAAFLATKGTLASRLYAALAAGDSKGGDSRGRQSAAIMVAFITSFAQSLGQFTLGVSQCNATLEPLRSPAARRLTSPRSSSAPAEPAAPKASRRN